MSVNIDYERLVSSKLRELAEFQNRGLELPIETQEEFGGLIQKYRESDKFKQGITA